MNKIIWTKKQARDFLVNYHMINTKDNPSIEDVFERIQTIQYDPLNVVGTNSELVLQSRIKNFKKEDLRNALYYQRYLIDGWDKQMSIYQTKYFPHFTKVREDRAQGSINSTLKYLDFDTTPFIDEVYGIIKEKSPIFSSKIKVGESVKSKWFSTKPSTLAIDYLFHLGKIGIYTRKNTQKQYELIENLIDNHNHNYPFTTDEEFIEYYLLRRIKSLGLTGNKSGVHFSGLHIDKKNTRNKYLDILCNKGQITKIYIEDIKEPFYLPTEALDYNIDIQDKISFIAPLDNLIWDRNLIKEIFDFDYKWEVYTPVKLRKYGYYVLPILKGSDFIGRIEFDKQRKQEPLIIKNIWFNKGIRQSKKLDNKLQQAHKRFSKYLGAVEVR